MHSYFTEQVLFLSSIFQRASPRVKTSFQPFNISTFQYYQCHLTLRKQELNDVGRCHQPYDQLREEHCFSSLAAKQLLVRVAAR